jgi:hypothetical protein
LLPSVTFRVLKLIELAQGNMPAGKHHLQI